MKKNGNTAVNKVYNPKNVKPGIPLDVDEVDSAMERFIRQKYQERSLVDGKPRPPSRNDDYTARSVPRDSGEGSPPPLPPKKGKIFGFGLRAASSAYPPSNPERHHLPLSPTMNNAFHINKNAKSKVVTPSIKLEIDPVMEAKLQTLHDMGFPDQKRNSTVLKGLGGNLERTIESLVRLGEGSQPNSRSRTPVTSPKVTPMNGDFPSEVTTSQASMRSTNPFDQSSGPGTVGLSFVQPQTQQQDAPQQRQASNNPFDLPTQQSSSIQALDQSLQNLQLSQQAQQPLFPNSTGGYPSSQPQMPAARFQQSMTPPVPSMPPQYMYGASVPSGAGNYNPFIQTQQQQPSQFTGNNPYATSTTSSPASSTNPFFNQTQSFNTQSQGPPSMPFIQRSQTLPVAEDIFAAPPSHQYRPTQQNYQPQGTFAFQNVVQAQPSQQPQLQSPFDPAPINRNPVQVPAFFDAQSLSQNQTQNPGQTLYQQQPQKQHIYSQAQQQSLYPQQTGRIDKHSIMALYNYPSPAAQPLPTIYDVPTSRLEGQMQQQQLSQPFAAPEPVPFQQTKRSVTMPVAPNASARNPFMPGRAAPVAGISQHSSRDSMAVSGLGSGRHSPDAFANLSAHHVR